MQIEEASRFISFFHFTCSPSAAIHEIQEARLSALRNHKQQPIQIDIDPEEDDSVSVFNVDDQEALEKTTVLTQKERQELVAASAQFIERNKTVKAEDNPLPPSPLPSNLTHDVSPMHQQQMQPPPHRGRGRPPKNANANVMPAATAGTPFNGRSTPMSDGANANSFMPSGPLSDSTLMAMRRGGAVGPQNMMPPPISIHSASIPAVAANAPSPILYAQQRELAAPMQVPPPLPPCPWFDPTAISQEEVDELSSAFPLLKAANPVDPADIPSVAYLQLRNTLIDVYRRNSSQKLTLAECRKHCGEIEGIPLNENVLSDGDLSVVIRMLSFLERNRLVNYALMPPPNVSGQQGFGSSLAGNLSSTGGIDPVTRKLKEEIRDHWTRTPTCTACDRICLYSFYVLSPNVYGSMLPLSHLHPAVWCSDCAREVPYNQCLMKVNLPPFYMSGGASSWSEQQINVLFDAIEAHVPDWLTVSRIVSRVPGNPTRSPSECLALFLSMPLAESASCATPSTTADSQSPSDATGVTSNKTNSCNRLSPAGELAAMEVLLNAVNLLVKNEPGDNMTDIQTSVITDIGRSAEKHYNNLTRPAQYCGDEDDQKMSKLHGAEEDSEMHQRRDNNASSIWSDLMVQSSMKHQHSSEDSNSVVNSEDKITHIDSSFTMDRNNPSNNSPDSSYVTLGASDVTLDSMLNDVSRMS